jgi:outer membrane protein assembly factor BamB
VTATFEFQTRLRAELRAAAEREQRRGASGGAAAAARSLLAALARSAPAAAAVTAAIIAALAVASIVLISGSERRPVAPPKVVDERSFADSLGPIFAAYGSVWMSDTGGGELLRVEPRTRRVTARLSVDGEVSIAAGAGAVWALQQGATGSRSVFHGPLLRIDPRTNRVTAQVPLRTPTGQPFAAFEMHADRSHIWVGGPGGALRIDPNTNRVASVVASSGSLFTSDFALVRNGLWAITTAGRLQAYDPATGTRLRNLPLAAHDVSNLRGTRGGALIATVPSGLARLDPHTGRALWRADIGQRATAWTEAGGLIWARSSRRLRDRLSAVDPETGHILTSIDLDDFSGSAVTAIDDELWLSTVSGNVTIVRR